MPDATVGLPERHQPVSADQQEAADDRGVSPLSPARSRLAGTPERGRDVEDHARDQERIEPMVNGGIDSTATRIAM